MLLPKYKDTTLSYMCIVTEWNQIVCGRHLLRVA